MRIGVDTGGTFTDFVFVHGREVRIAKLPSTPSDPAAAILAGIAAEAPPAGTVLVHGTTVATNALLERRLARVTFVTNAGLEDVLEIGRQARPDLYALDVQKAAPLVPRERRLGVAERRGADGRALARPSKSELAALVERVRRTRPESIAIGLLFAFLDDGEERRIARALAPLGVPISTSADVAPEVREFERFETTVANAALVPVVSEYLARLERGLDDLPLFVFQSNGGMARADVLSRYPVRLVLSGPAGGAVAAARILDRAGVAAAITLDMGGTSTDVALLAGAPLRRGEIDFDGRPLIVPSLDIQSVGAGGGSIAWVDRAGLLRVGPRSAGSDPGPACYGRSKEPTVTDAHLVLGRLPTALAGGSLALDPDRSHRALEALARRLGLDRFAAAEGVLAVADATMARAARVVAVERGRDPRHLPLFAFGGAGPLHAARLIAALPAQCAIVPRLPGNLSAYGMALADPERDRARTILLADPDRDRRALDDALDRLEAEARDELARDGLLDERRRLRVERTVDCRYAGQSFTLEVPARGSIRRTFDRRHAARFGHAFPERRIEAVHVRVRAVVPSRRGTPARTPPGRARAAPRSASSGERRVRFGGTWRTTPIYDRDRLRAGHRLVGPAVIEELGSTTVVDPGFFVTVDGDGNLVLNRR